MFFDVTVLCLPLYFSTRDAFGGSWSKHVLVVLQVAFEQYVNFSNIIPSGFLPSKVI
jgi:hypothetical protein